MGYFFLLRDLFPLHTLFATDTVVFFQVHSKLRTIPKDCFGCITGGIRAGVAECHRNPASAKFITAHGGASAFAPRSLFFSGVKMTAKMKYLKGTKEFKVFPDNDSTGVIHILVIKEVGERGHHFLTNFQLDA